jgi:hypothetical protein
MPPRHTANQRQVVYVHVGGDAKHTPPALDPIFRNFHVQQEDTRRRHIEPHREVPRPINVPAPAIPKSPFIHIPSTPPANPKPDPETNSEEEDEEKPVPALNLGGLSTPKPTPGGGILGILRSSQKKPKYKDTTEFFRNAGKPDLQIVAENIGVPHWQSLNKAALKASLLQHYLPEVREYLAANPNLTRSHDAKPLPAPVFG